MDDSHYNDLLLELECPICTNYMTPPIRQCATGHSICENCRRKIEKCALCQGVFTESRNISLEGLAVKIRYPCINKDSGCNIKLAYNEREVHESKCGFKGYRCEMESCSWVGKPEDILQHWASKKITLKPYGANNVCYMNIKPRKLYQVNIIEALDKLFWFKCKIINKKIHWVVQYIGEADEADNYYYEIVLFKPGRTKQKVLLSNYCKSLDIDNAVLFGSAAPVEMVEPFLNEDQSLIYNMTVHEIKGNKGKEKSAANISQQKQRSRSKGPAALKKM